MFTIEIISAVVGVRAYGKAASAITYHEQRTGISAHKKFRGVILKFFT